ncbi:MAG: replication-associated recombination protein A [Candidatus Stahlbacteria bacterium]|nr:MAG: replication-associated recombination protein A [Candidatus Stahlbacteria bacterium]
MKILEDLFSNGDGNPPLSFRVRPESFDDFFGQEEIIGNGKPLRKMIEKGKVPSMVFWGPPGSGKTTLTYIIAEKMNANIKRLSATGSGVSDLREVIKNARYLLKNKNKSTILFIDEIHRFNKAQQDVLLPWVEKGTLILIGATTENPSFEIISPLLSRVRVYRLKPLEPGYIRKIIEKALGKDEEIKRLDIKIENDAMDYLIKISGGDARVALDTLEFAINVLEGEKIIIKKELLSSILQKQILYDKGGEEHYNLISAFIKSVRGSDPDAALYWMARMLEGGEDPLFIARRMIILASEDIGNADPKALQVAVAAKEAVNFLGMPEAGIVLSQATTYLATAPKSNASYVAYSRARKTVKENPDYPVPLHLRNAPTELLKEAGYGKDYKYPHDFPDQFIKENYFPEGMKKKIFYNPQGKGYEKKIKEMLKSLWKKR